jgi:protein-tyrosine phosphatase
MTKILFICHGNICRSPMAEFVMKDLVRRAGLSERFEISSAATSTEEIGNPVYPPVRKLLTEHGISCAGKTARQLTNADYDRFDLLIGMDQENLRNMYRICGGDYADKMHLLAEYAGRRGDIPDPWYTRDFHATWQAVENGCKGLMERLRNKTDGDEQAKNLYRH